MLDDITESIIDTATDKLQGEESKEKTSFGGGLLRFFISLIWFVIVAGVSILAMVVMGAGAVSNTFGGSNVLCYLAVAVSLLVGLITFLVPYLRKKGSFTRYLGLVAFGDAAWWIYLIITEFH